MFDLDMSPSTSILHKALSLQVLGLSSAEINDGSVFPVGSLKFEPRMPILEDAHRLLKTVGRR